MTATDERTTRPRAGWFRALESVFGPIEPHLARGPFARWPLATDVALAVIVFVVSLVTVAASAVEDGDSLTMSDITDRPGPAVVLLAVAAGVLVWRRAHAVEVTAVVLGMMVVWAIAGYGDGQDVALVVATYSVGRYTIDHRASAATVVAAVVISLLGTVIDSSQRVDLAPAAILVALPWYVGRRVRNRGDYVALLEDRARRIEAEQAARAQQAVAQERARIARELHDVVAHQVSMMTVQAGAAKMIARDDPDAAIDAMGDVERGGREALGELRHLLGVLRPPGEDSGSLDPQPGIADLPKLVENLDSTGADVTLTVGELPDGISAAVDLGAYRIIQESLTNVVKHAGPDPVVAVIVGVDGDHLVVEVTNTTVVASADLPPSGYGIVGMRERASLLGGTLIAGPVPPDQFRVQASLPLGSDRP